MNDGSRVTSARRNRVRAVRQLGSLARSLTCRCVSFLPLSSACTFVFFSPMAGEKRVKMWDELARRTKECFDAAAAYVADAFFFFLVRCFFFWYCVFCSFVSHSLSLVFCVCVFFVFLCVFLYV